MPLKEKKYEIVANRSEETSFQKSDLYISIYGVTSLLECKYLGRVKGCWFESLLDVSTTWL